MIDLATTPSRPPRIYSGKGRNGHIPGTAALCAALVAIAVLIAAAWHPPRTHADGGAAARNQTAAASGESIRAYALRLLRALTDDSANNWVRYWQARADCDAAPAQPAAPRHTALNNALTSAAANICARLDALLGVNLAAHPPRGDTHAGGLQLNEPGAAPGYTLFIVEDAQNAYLIDTLGRTARKWRLGKILSGEIIRYTPKILDSGNLMAIAKESPSSPTSLMEVDPRGNIVWQYKLRGLHHDFLKMPNGNFLLLAVARKTREQAIAAGANPEFIHETGIQYDYLLEVRPTGASGGEIVWQWSPWDHLIQNFDPTKRNYGVIAEHPELIDINFLPETLSKHHLHAPWDWLHTNAIDYNPELDQIMLSPRHFSELWIIDHSPTTQEARGNSGGNSGMGGDLLYRWGNPRAYQHGDHADQRLFWQHQTHWIPPGLPGAGNILLFNNGKEFKKDQWRYYSSIDELTPPINGYRYRRAGRKPYPPDRLEWTYAAETPADFYASVFSGAQRLPNGNTLIVDGPAGTISQVTPNGKTTWKYIVPSHYHISLWQGEGTPTWLTYGTPEDPPAPVAKNAVYRAHWYPPDHPGLQALDLAPGARLEDYPNLLDWARAAITAGYFGQRLADAPYDIYIDNNADKSALIYFKQPCAAQDARAKFFLHIFPSDTRDLPANRQEVGFDNLDFYFSGWGKSLDRLCVAIAPLPPYPIQRIRTGQFVSGEGAIWRAEINLNN